jgi:hypothetical protein
MKIEKFHKKMKIRALFTEGLVDMAVSIVRPAITANTPSCPAGKPTITNNLSSYKAWREHWDSAQSAT